MVGYFSRILGATQYQLDLHTERNIMIHNKAINKLEIELNILKDQLADSLKWYSEKNESSKEECIALGWQEAVQYLIKELTKYKQQESEEVND